MTHYGCSAERQAVIQLLHPAVCQLLRNHPAEVRLGISGVDPCLHSFRPLSTCRRFLRPPSISSLWVRRFFFSSAFQPTHVRRRLLLQRHVRRRFLLHSSFRHATRHLTSTCYVIQYCLSKIQDVANSQASHKRFDMTCQLHLVST